MKKIIISLMAVVISIVSFTRSWAQTSTQTHNSKWVNQTEFGMLNIDKDTEAMAYLPYVSSSSYIDPRSIYYQPLHFNAYENDPVFTVYHFIGRKIKPWLIVGGGAGMDFFTIRALPVGLGVRTYLNPSKKISPSFSLDAGYSFKGEKTNKPTNISDDYSQKTTGGVFFNPSICLRINMNKDDSAFTIGMGYRQQSITETIKIPSALYDSYSKTSFRRLSIKLGFVF
jgi:hypothetical protein